jgi:hypothetical protein
MQDEHTKTDDDKAENSKKRGRETEVEELDSLLEEPSTKRQNHDNGTTTNIAPLVGNNIQIDELGELLECCICKDIMIYPYILHCSHSFCKKCVVEWLRVNKSCPTCRKMILKPPAQNKHVQLILDLLVPKIDEEERTLYNDRKKEHEEFFKAELDRFKNVISNATDSGTKFLKIDKRWSEKEKRIFRIGLERYEGEELKTYCELTGFTKEYIQTARPSQLLIAARNVDTQIPQLVTNAIDYELLRKILMDVISS